MEEVATKIRWRITIAILAGAKVIPKINERYLFDIFSSRKLAQKDNLGPKVTFLS